MKRGIILFISLALVFCLASCADVKKELELSQDRANVRSIEIYKPERAYYEGDISGFLKNNEPLTVLESEHHTSFLDELCNIDRRPFDEIVLTPEDYQKIYDNGYSDLIEEGYSPEMNKIYHRMVLKPDGTCTAWKNGKCLIHDFSPTLCRAFPFYFDMFSGLCAINCEGFSDENWTELEDCKYALDAAKKMYEFWLDFYSESQPAEK